MKKLRDIFSRKQQPNLPELPELPEVKYDKNKDERLTRHYHNINHKERAAIDEWLGDSSHINRHVTGAENYGSEMDEHVKHLKNAISKHQAPENFTVYSGIHKPLDPSTKSLTFHTFRAGSLSLKVAKDFSSPDKNFNKHVISISIPKGSHGLGTKPHPEEYFEYIFHPGSKIHIHKIEHFQIATIYHSHLIHDGIKEV